MYEFRVHTLVDITENGNLKKEFPFKTKSNNVIHDKHTLIIAKNQNNNFNTMLQLLQMRGNITWETPPMQLNDPIANMKFGTAYEGKQNTWHFSFLVEQTEVYGDPQDPTANLTSDFDLVLRLEGACRTCEVNQMTLKNGIEESIKKYAPEINSIKSI